MAQKNPAKDPNKNPLIQTGSERLTLGILLYNRGWVYTYSYIGILRIPEPEPDQNSMNGQRF